jgi:hypothetical protein
LRLLVARKYGNGKNVGDPAQTIAFAKDAGVATAFATQWLSGHRQVPRDRLSDVARLLGSPVEYLLGVTANIAGFVPVLKRLNCGKPVAGGDLAPRLAPTSAWSESLTACEASGDGLSPIICDGDMLICDTKAPIFAGDYVAVGEKGALYVGADKEMDVYICGDAPLVILQNERKSIDIYKIVEIYKRTDSVKHPLSFFLSRR